MRFLLDGQAMAVIKELSQYISLALLSSLYTKSSQFSLQTKPYTAPCVLACASASENSCWNIIGSKYKRAQLKSWRGALCGKWKPPEDCNFLQRFWCYCMLNIISARSLCSGKFLTNSMGMKENIFSKESFPKLCIAEDPYDKLFFIVC